jgi:hypothetical protein
MLSAAAVTVIYDAVVSKEGDALPAQDELWLTPAALTRVSRFVLKPEGACLEELCVPIPKAREAAFLRQQDGSAYFNLTELARTLQQAIVHDTANEIWVFGPRPEAQMKLQNTLEAPDFTLPDWRGVPRALKDFRGKKVLLITWASW